MHITLFTNSKRLSRSCKAVKFGLDCHRQPLTEVQELMGQIARMQPVNYIYKFILLWLVKLALFSQLHYKKTLLSVSYPLSQGCEIANYGLDRRLRYRWQSVAKSHTWSFQSEIDTLLLISVISYVCSQKNLLLTCSYYRLNSSNDYQLLILWL